MTVWYAGAYAPAYQTVIYTKRYAPAYQTVIYTEWHAPAYQTVIYIEWHMLLHTRRSSTQSDICSCIPDGHLHRVTYAPAYQTVIYTEWHKPGVPLIQQFSWWWAHGCPKHVQNINKHTWKIVCQVGYLQGSQETQFYYSNIRRHPAAATCKEHERITKRKATFLTKIFKEHWTFLSYTFPFRRKLI